jgi:hypothetical protein
MTEPDEPEPEETPDGAAVFPLIPPELGADPLLLAVIHSVVFLSGSEDKIVQPDAAEEALEYLAGYLQQLKGERLRKVREDLVSLGAFARQEKWPKQLTLFLKTFLTDFGVGDGGVL